jgi:hypothetical protein
MVSLSNHVTFVLLRGFVMSRREITVRLKPDTTYEMTCRRC